MIPVTEALARLFALTRPTEVEEVPLDAAAGRVLARPMQALRDQPPFAASAMDGYAIRGAELKPGAGFRVIGESAAGRGWPGVVNPGEAVRIFTGAPMPEGADHVVIQEDVRRQENLIFLSEGIDESDNIRPAGVDFRKGAEIAAPRRLAPADLALLASFNHPLVPVHRRPDVVLIATGDELVMPGETPGPGQIIASNSFGIAALLRQWGARVRVLPIVPDDLDALVAAFEMAMGADLVISIGGASVGDHDLVGSAVKRLGMDPAFWKVAVRPGKPLMAGKLGGSAMVGLPGNPVSSIVCTTIFILPLIAAMQGLPAAPLPRLRGRAAEDLPPGGPREHYMRARMGEDGIVPAVSQDSSLLSLLAQSDALLVRPVHAPAVPKGGECEYIPLRY